MKSAGKPTRARRKINCPFVINLMTVLNHASRARVVLVLLPIETPFVPGKKIFK